MAISRDQMKIITEKLEDGLKFRRWKINPKKVHAWANPTSKMAFLGARASGQLKPQKDGFGQESGSSIVAQLQTGELFPDQLVGWSTKTILAGLLVLAIFKMRGK